MVHQMAVIVKKIQAPFPAPSAECQKKLLKMQADFDQHQARIRDQTVAVRAYVPSFLKITARDIEQWVDGNLEARSRLPVLLRKLVHSTGQGLTHVDFRQFHAF